MAADQTAMLRKAAAANPGLLLAPLTRGGTVPFRRLCYDFGARITMSEMVYSRQLIKGDRLEQARLRRTPEEISGDKTFGVQLASNDAEELLRSAEIVAESGASFIDLNCGCPIYEATRRGLGAAMLRKPARLAEMVRSVSERCPLPFSIKIRTGPERGLIAQELVEMLQVTRLRILTDCENCKCKGQDTKLLWITIHGRTMKQRYSKAADWDLISSIAAQSSTPIIGNGDILTHLDAKRRLTESNCLATMTGRGALVKPWIFKEVIDSSSWLPTTDERVAVLFRLVTYMKEYFGDDERGKKKSFYFLPWHLGFLSRYRPFSPEMLADVRSEHPLMQTRIGLATDYEDEDELSPLEKVLRIESEAATTSIANLLWKAQDIAEAVSLLHDYAQQNCQSLLDEATSSDDRTAATAKLAQG